MKSITVTESVHGAMSTNHSPAIMIEIKSEISNIKSCVSNIMEYLIS